MSQQQTFVGVQGGLIPITSFVQTTDDTPTILLSYNLGTAEGTWLFNFNIVAYDVTDKRGLGADASYVIRTTASSVTEVSEASITYSEDSVMAPTEVFFGVVGTPNRMTVDVTGLVGKTINWKISGNLLFVGV